MLSLKFAQLPCSLIDELDERLPIGLHGKKIGEQFSLEKRVFQTVDSKENKRTWKLFSRWLKKKSQMKISNAPNHGYLTGAHEGFPIDIFL